MASLNTRKSLVTEIISELIFSSLTSLKSIALLAKETVTIKSAQSANDAYDIFNENPQVDSIPVLDAHKPLGMIYRQELMEAYSDIYGRALFSKKSALDIMSHNSMILEHSL